MNARNGVRWLAALALSALSMLAPVAVSGQAVISGRVTAEGRPLPRAEVALERLARRVAADSTGLYRLAGLPPGKHTLVIRALGFSPARRDVVLAAGDQLEVNAELTRVPSVLEPLVTTATLKATYVDDSPVKIEVITARVLQRNVTNNLMDNVSFMNGLNQQVDCGVCFTNNIRINGMEGPYTAVLIDGAPVMSALATVYGFNGLDPSLIEQVEVVKGPNSTLFGSEAMGGVINIITKEPRFAPRLSVSTFGTSHGETNLDLGLAAKVGRAWTLLSGNVAHNERFVDNNEDGFSDLPLTTRLALFNKWSVGDKERHALDLTARLYHEKRFGGVRDWTWADRGSSSVYGESILTDRVELLGSYRLPLEGQMARLQFAFNHHQQDSFYGTQPYLGVQRVSFAQLLWNRRLGARHDLLFGGTLRHQSYRDSTAFQQTREARVVPGVFVQDEMTLGGDWSLLGGMRLDRHAVHGVIPSPRLAVKWEADEHTTLRVNAATGFRVVNLFAEEHAALTGARQVRVPERLQPERSYNVTANLNRAFHAGSAADALVLDVDAFYTHFTNRIVPDFDSDPNLIIYRNLDGSAETRGVAANVAFNAPEWPVYANVGATLQRVSITASGVRRAAPFAPGFQGVFTFGYNFRGARIVADYTGRVVGPMKLPAHAGLADRSTWYTEQHLQLTRTMRDGLDAFVSIKNLFGYVQRDALVNPGDPFGDGFDTARVFGPLQGRRFLLGGRYALSR